MASPQRNTVLRKQELALYTRLANQVSNEFDPSQPNPQDQHKCDVWARRYNRAIRRTLAPSYGYNCHGLTFGARRTQVWSSSEVEHIVKEDGYVQINVADALPGDIAIYYSLEEPIEIEHSAVVVEKRTIKDDLRAPLVVSKWGPCEEYIHWYMECPYVNVSVKFFRLPR
jgi:hypothetical protein